DDADPADFRGTQGMCGEDHRIFRILDNVDLLAAQLANDGLYAHALHTDACAHAVHIAVAALHGDLGALPGFPRASANRHRAIVNLRDFLLEQPHYQLRGGSRYEHTWALAGFVDQLDHAANAVTDAVTLETRLLFLGELGFRLTQVEDIIGPFDAL